MTTLGASVAPLLAALGVERVFGLPGNHTVELYRGLAETNIVHTTARHEQGAAFMADGYARATGAVGVCFVISGPGLLNAATAAAQAQADCVPLLVISAALPVRTQGAPIALHEMHDQAAAGRAIFRESITITTAEALASELPRVYERMQGSARGAYHLQIPIDAMAKPVRWVPAAAAGTFSIVPKPDAVEAAAAVLNEAARPLVLLGGGAMSARVQALVETLDAPVLNTVNGKGVLSFGHPLAVGGSPSLPGLQAALRAADVVLALGTQFAETDYDLLMADPLALEGQLVRVDVDERNLQHPYPAAVAVQADVGAFVEQVLPRLVARARSGEERSRALREVVREERHYHPDFSTFFSALTAAAEDLVVVGDSARPNYYAAWMFEQLAPRRYWHSASGFGTLGYALPAAIGAALGSNAPVAALIGDGGLQFTLPELATAVDAGLGLAIVIWANSGYEEISRSFESANVPQQTCQISSPDFAMIAAAYGCAHAAPSTADELTDSLRVAFEASTPTLIRVDQAKFTSLPSGGWYG